MTRFKGKDKVGLGANMIAKRSFNRNACVAVLRKQAVIMHALRRDGTFHVGDPAAVSTGTPQRAHGKTGRLLGAHR